MAHLDFETRTETFNETYVETDVKANTFILSLALLAIALLQSGCASLRCDVDDGCRTVAHANRRRNSICSS